MDKFLLALPAPDDAVTADATPLPAILCLLYASQLPTPEWGDTLFPRHTQGQCTQGEVISHQASEHTWTLDTISQGPQLPDVLGPVVLPRKRSSTFPRDAMPMDIAAVFLKRSLKLWKESVALSLSRGLPQREVC